MLRINTFSSPLLCFFHLSSPWHLFKEDELVHTCHRRPLVYSSRGVKQCPARRLCMWIPTAPGTGSGQELQEAEVQSHQTQLHHTHTFSESHFTFSNTHTQMQRQKQSFKAEAWMIFFFSFHLRSSYALRWITWVPKTSTLELSMINHQFALKHVVNNAWKTVSLLPYNECDLLLWMNYLNIPTNKTNFTDFLKAAAIHQTNVNTDNLINCTCTS